MKKKILTLIMIIVLMTISFIAGYAASNNFTNQKEENENSAPKEENENSVSKEENENSKPEVITPQTVFTKDMSYDYIINNTLHKITFSFFVRNGGAAAGYDEFTISVNVFLDDKRIDGPILIDSVQTEEEYKNSNIYKLINVDNNIKTISDGNKEYIVILIEYLLPAGGPEPNPTIVNDSGQILKVIHLMGGQSIELNSSRKKFYQKTNKQGYTYFDKYVIEDNAIYYLAQDCNIGFIYDDTEKTMIAIEYKVTVNNDMVIEEQIGRHNAFGSGAIC